MDYVRLRVSRPWQWHPLRHADGGRWADEAARITVTTRSGRVGGVDVEALQDTIEVNGLPGRAGSIGW